MGISALKPHGRNATIRRTDNGRWNLTRSGNYEYYYYPDAGVYFHVYSGFYYYQDRGRWLKARVLPKGIYLKPRIRRPIIVRDPAPYIRYRDHYNKFQQHEKFKPDPRRDRTERNSNRRRHEDYRRR